MSEPDTFETADYYDARDYENLTCDDPEQALEEYFELNIGTGDPETEIRDHGPITVTAYKRQELPDAEVKRWCSQMAEMMAERFLDDYGDPNWDSDCGLTEKKLEAFSVDELFPMVNAFLRKEATVWHCDPVAKRVYSSDECVALMRDCRPDWFEEEKTDD